MGEVSQKEYKNISGRHTARRSEGTCRGLVGKRTRPKCATGCTGLRKQGCVRRGRLSWSCRPKCSTTPAEGGCPTSPAERAEPCGWFGGIEHRRAIITVPESP